MNFMKILKAQLMRMAGVRCPYCHGTDVVDNGDNWYCYTCNATFEGPY